MESRLAVDLLHSAVPLVGNVRDHHALYETIGDAPIVLIGEATHGTHEFYRQLGVVYHPQTELQSHYFVADLLQQFDAVYHYDVTRAVEPPETFPTGE